MRTQLRIWRVVPTSKTGLQAPSFFVETTEFVLEKANATALKVAKTKTRLSDFKDWVIKVEKTYLRKDDFGRYLKYHQ